MIDVLSNISEEYIFCESSKYIAWMPGVIVLIAVDTFKYKSTIYSLAIRII